MNESAEKETLTKDEVANLRWVLNNVADRLKKARTTRNLSLAYTHLEDAMMRLEKEEEAWD